jgi:hypothetical protein
MDLTEPVVRTASGLVRGRRDPGQHGIAFKAADPARLTAAADAVRPSDHAEAWGPVAFTPTPFSPVVDGDALPVAP